MKSVFALTQKAEFGTHHYLSFSNFSVGGTVELGRVLGHLINLNFVGLDGSLALCDSRVRLLSLQVGFVV